jgi:hypothetical protein
MLLADMVVRTIDAALQNGKVTFNRVRVRAAANVLAKAVVDVSCRSNSLPMVMAASAHQLSAPSCHGPQFAE